MKNRSHGSRGTRPGMRKGLTGLLALVLVLALAIGGTIAFLTLKTETKTNTFTPSQVTADVEEDVKDGIKSNVQVKNTGDTPAYIRVAVIANSVDEAGNIIGSADVSASLCGSNWTAGSDGYYYYNGVVAPGALTDGNLLKSDINLEGKQVTILAEAIQAEPAKAVTEAWGMSFSNGAWS